MTRIVGVVCATSKYIEQTNTHTSKRPPWGWRERGGVGLFFSRNDGITESGKKLWRGGGWWLVGFPDGWRDREEIIAGTGIQDSGPLQGPPISGNFNSFYRVLPALLVVGDPSWLKKWWKKW